MLLREKQLSKSFIVLDCMSRNKICLNIFVGVTDIVLTINSIKTGVIVLQI